MIFKELSLFVFVLFVILQIVASLSVDLVIKNEEAQSKYTIGESTSNLPNLSIRGSDSVSLHLKDLSNYRNLFLIADLLPGKARSYGIPLNRNSDYVKLNLDIFHAPTGTYAISIAYSNNFEDKGQFPLGKIKWSPKPSALYSAFKAKPSISHKFRPDEKQPNIAISVSFSLFVILPWIVLVPMWYMVGSRLPSKITGLTFIFEACLIAFAGLAFMYWTSITLVQAIVPFLVLASITVGVGVNTLREHHQWHLVKPTNS